MGILINRIPDKQSIISVFAVTVFLVYGWTLLTSFWKVPSWLFYMSVGEILSIYAYAFVLAFAECMFILFLLISISFVLPRNWWKDIFSSIGVVWMLVIESTVMLRLYTIRQPTQWAEFVYDQGPMWGYAVGIGLMVSILVLRFSWLQNVIHGFAKRMVPFLYVYLPISVISLIVVFVRNVL